MSTNSTTWAFKRNNPFFSTHKELRRREGTLKNRRQLAAAGSAEVDYYAPAKINGKQKWRSLKAGEFHSTGRCAKNSSIRET